MPLNMIIIPVLGSIFLIVLFIAISRSIRKVLKHEDDLRREREEKELELLQAQIDYYNSRKEEKST